MADSPNPSTGANPSEPKKQSNDIFLLVLGALCLFAFVVVPLLLLSGPSDGQPSRDVASIEAYFARHHCCQRRLAVRGNVINSCLASVERHEMSLEELTAVALK
jgi:hypothetical protein